MNLSPERLAFLLVPLALVSFVLSPQARADCEQGCDIEHGNTLLGDYALLSNTTGTFNTATGAHALQSNTTGHDNTAIGNSTLIVNITGFENTAIGHSALWTNTGSGNTATGANALYFNGSGLNNTASGSYALFAHAGSNNTAMGANALGGGFGSNNIALGYSAGVNVQGSDNIDIGNAGVAGDSGFIRIGTSGTHTAAFIAGIRETPIAGAIQVGINANGQLGVRGSSARFKKDIEPMDNASEAILGLKPVTFRYKQELDTAGIPQFGLVAEDVEKINPDLVARDEQGKPYTVRYEAVNAMLLNEFLKEHRKVEQLEATVAQQRKDFEAAMAQLKAQVSKVSAQFELSKPAPRMVAYDH